MEMVQQGKVIGKTFSLARTVAQEQCFNTAGEKTEERGSHQSPRTGLEWKKKGTFSGGKASSASGRALSASPKGEKNRKKPRPSDEIQPKRIGKKGNALPLGGERVLRHGSSRVMAGRKGQLSEKDKNLWERGVNACDVRKHPI